MSDYDPVCHCGTQLSKHSVYEGHPFTEMETEESMSAKIAALTFERDALAVVLAKIKVECEHPWQWLKAHNATIPFEAREVAVVLVENILPLIPYPAISLAYHDKKVRAETFRTVAANADHIEELGKEVIREIILDWAEAAEK